MAVQLAPNPALSLPLLVDPIKPVANDSKRGVYGWTRDVKTTRNRSVYLVETVWVRNHDHDAQGALVQHMIAWYVLCDVQRQELARCFGFSERQIQSYISGVSWRSYGRAILDELARMGIAPSNRHWHAKPRRSMEIAAAANDALQAAVDLIGRPDAPADAVEAIRTRARLLAVRWPE